MPTTNKEQEIRIAQRRVEGFAQQFGEAHRNLARHAAFPLVLTPDLLYQIWANFVPEAPWTTVAHVLLSRLCRQVSYEMYEMDIADRNLLLRELKGEFGQERFDELGEFLLDYVAQRLTDDDADTQDLREAQEWTALAYTKPDEVARELAQALSKRVNQEDMGDMLRLASLVETLAEPLLEAGFEPFLIYIDGIRSFVYGDLEQAVSHYNHLRERAPNTNIGGVSLAIPRYWKHLILIRKLYDSGLFNILKPGHQKALYKIYYEIPKIDELSYDWRVIRKLILGEKINNVFIPGYEIAPGIFTGLKVNINWDNVDITGPVYIGDMTTIKDGAKIIGPTIIGSNCWICSGATIECSVIFEWSRLGPGVRLVDKLVFGRYCVDNTGKVIDVQAASLDWLISDARQEPLSPTPIERQAIAELLGVNFDEQTT
ncbi:hypothetical protein [Nostoc sp. C110]|uniref:hypothetical protein n=1 Tax=Nostoc sp. C110 TaxID=3349876 RepID=UPI00370CFC51